MLSENCPDMKYVDCCNGPSRESSKNLLAEIAKRMHTKAYQFTKLSDELNHVRLSPESEEALYNLLSNYRV